MQATRIPDLVLAKVRARTQAPNATGCTVNTYAVGSHGYPQLTWFHPETGERGTSLIHRLVWIAAFGPIPDGMTVDHMCKERRCCNVEHLRLLSNYENARRTGGRDWPVGRCANGHPNSELHTQPGGKRVCRPCNSEWQRRYNDKRRAA